MNTLTWLGKANPHLAGRLLALVVEPPPKHLIAEAKAELAAAKKLKYIMTPQQMQRATRLINSGGKTACDAYLREEENKFTDERLRMIQEAEQKLAELTKPVHGFEGLLLEVIALGVERLENAGTAKGKA